MYETILNIFSKDEQFYFKNQFQLQFFGEKKHGANSTMQAIR